MHLKYGIGKKLLRLLFEIKHVWKTMRNYTKYKKINTNILKNNSLKLKKNIYSFF